MDTTIIPLPDGWLRIKGEFPNFLNRAHVVNVWRDENQHWNANLCNGGTLRVSESQAMLITGISNQQFWDAL